MTLNREVGGHSIQPDPESGGRLGLVLYGLAILVICVAFQGSRGLFEPDEGRYADAALAMYETGDWFVPRLQGLVYLDKPPVIYWTLAAGIKLFGVGEWSLRIWNALALAGTAYLLAAWSGAVWGKRVGRLAGAAYVTTFLPGLAANALTPDTLLTLWTTAASVSYWKWHESQPLGHRLRWAILLGCAIGLGLLTKGPAALVLVAPMVVHGSLDSGPRRFLSRPELWAAALLGTTIGLSWYAGLARSVPGAASYFFDNQVAGRLWADTYDRHSAWWKGAEVYGPVLVFGFLPWSLTWLRLWRSSQRWQQLRNLWSDSLHRYLVLSIVLPLVVFSLASSKLPLYVLPIAPYVVMLTMSQARANVSVRWGRRALIAALALILLKGGVAYAPSSQDTRALARALRQSDVAATECIDAFGAKVHGLGLYGYPRSTWHSIWPEPYPYFEAPPVLTEDLSGLLARCGGRVRFLVRNKHRQPAVDIFAQAQLTCREEPVASNLTLFSCRADAASGVKSDNL